MTTYKDAGVDIDAGEEAVRRMAPLVRSTFTPGVLADIGAFGGFFEIARGRYHEPVLVSSIDGVGTKLKVAFLMRRYDTIGQDLVNHCVNDIAVCGADPLFFLDYFAAGKLDPAVSEELMQGLALACRDNECALIGGETAEMPDLYAAGEFDLAGAVVGVVEKGSILGAERVSAGDTLVGIRSAGLHTNGYTLARKVLLSAHGVSDRPRELEGESVGESLLRVHRAYLPLIRELREMASTFVHVTGGGIAGNTLRMVKPPLATDIEFGAWQRPGIFRLIQRLGGVPEDDMRRTFNLGIGLVAIVPKPGPVVDLLRRRGEDPVVLGSVVS